MKSIIAYSVTIIFFARSDKSSAFLNGRPKHRSIQILNQEKHSKGSKVSSQPNLARGERYNDILSTIPSPKSIAARLNVRPTEEASAKTWKIAWNVHNRLLPLLHSTDSCKPPDSSLNLACMWWKALSGLDETSPVYDNGLSYDLLPFGWRRIVKFRRFPRLHHGNVELRTAYLDNAISQIVADIQKVGIRKIRLICMGAGYDTRGVKMLERGIIDEAVELDLPEVVTAKKRLLERLQIRRPWLAKYRMPIFISSDFNDIPEVKQKLSEIVSGSDKHIWHNIFVFEGVMIYLNKGVPSGLLNATSTVLVEKGLQEGSLCFADRLENVPSGDYVLGKEELEINGWRVKDWCPKPGLARHMGWSKLI